MEIEDKKGDTIKSRYGFWDYATLKFLKANKEIDYLSEKEFDKFRQLLVDRFASFIEKVQNIDVEPEKAGIIVKGYRNIIMSFAIALAHPKTQYFADDGFENLLLLMIEDIHACLGNQKEEFQDMARKLASEMVKLIYINQTDKVFPSEDPIIIKNIEIGQAKSDLLKKSVVEKNIVEPVEIITTKTEPAEVPEVLEKEVEELLISKPVKLNGLKKSKKKGKKK